MNKEQELIKRFRKVIKTRVDRHEIDDSLILRRGNDIISSEQCATICLSEMEREAVGFAEWKTENYQLWPGRGYYSKFHDGSHGKSHITPTFYTPSELYKLYKNQKQTT